MGFLENEGISKAVERSFMGKRSRSKEAALNKSSFFPIQFKNKEDYDKINEFVLKNTINVMSFIF